MMIAKECRQFVVEASRDHGKSHFWSYAYPLYKVYETAEPFYIALVSYSETQAEKNLKKIRQAVEMNPAFKHLAPTAKGSQWDHQHLDFAGGSFIEAFGLGSSMRGGHYHLIVIDDPSKDFWSISLAQQEQFYKSVMIPALRKGGQIAFVGNPVDLQDILWVMSQVEDFKTFKFPCWDKDMKPLWPEQYTYEDLMKRRAMVGENIFKREYLLERINAGENPFKKEWVAYYKHEDEEVFRVMTVDPTATEKGDPMAIVVTDTDKTGKTKVVYRESFHVSVKDAVGIILDKYEEMNPDVFGIETFAFQITMKVWLEAEMEKRGLNFNIIELEKQARLTYVGRIMALQPKMQSGELQFREDGSDEPLLNQILSWDPRSKTNRDDELVALAYQVKLWERPTCFKKKESIIQGNSFKSLLDGIKKRDSFMVDFSDFKRESRGPTVIF